MMIYCNIVLLQRPTMYAKKCVVNVKTAVTIRIVPSSIKVLHVLVFGCHNKFLTIIATIRRIIYWMKYVKKDILRMISFVPKHAMHAIIKGG